MRTASAASSSCHQLSSLSSFWNLIKVYTSKQMTVCSSCRQQRRRQPRCYLFVSVCVCVCVCIRVAWPENECRRQVASQLKILLKKSCGTKILVGLGQTRKLQLHCNKILRLFIIIKISAIGFSVFNHKPRGLFETFLTNCINYSAIYLDSYTLAFGYPSFVTVGVTHYWT